MEEIKLVQVPVIEHKLKEAGKKVSERLAALNIDGQVATIDTVKALKKLRAELNKESGKLKDQLKEVDKEVSAPMAALKELFKSEITDKYAKADDTLKIGIATVENKVKDEKEANLKVYFIELCQSEDIDFITFDKLNIEVNLSTSEKKYKEQINEFVQKACSDIDLIKTMQHEAEIMAEYKRTLNASKAIQDVKERKEAEEKEKERIRIQELNRRKREFGSIGMNFDEMTKTFVYNDNIYISADKVRDISKEDFNKVLVEFEEKIRTNKAGVARRKMLSEIGVDLSVKDCENMPENTWREFYEEQNKKFQSVKNKEFIEDLKTKKTEQKEPETVKEVTSEPQPETKAPEPLKAPIIEVKREILTAEFRVKATYKKLMKLKQFLIDNNYNYENI